MAKTECVQDVHGKGYLCSMRMAAPRVGQETTYQAVHGGPNLVIRHEESKAWKMSTMLCSVLQH